MRLYVEEFSSNLFKNNTHTLNNRHDPLSAQRDIHDTRFDSSVIKVLTSN